jgi:hypothetical protein
MVNSKSGRASRVRETVGLGGTVGGKPQYSRRGVNLVKKNTVQPQHTVIVRLAQLYLIASSKPKTTHNITHANAMRRSHR